MPPHRVQLAGDRPETGQRVLVAGSEAHHAVRVKRLGQGDALELLDGRGWRAAATVVGVSKAGKGDWTLEVEVTGAGVEPEPTPRVHVLASPPKGERLEEMIDQLSQVGAASWSPLVTLRTVVSPRTGKMLRAERVAAEAAKQCGRAWALRIGDPVHLADALARAGTLVLADPSGEPYAHDGSSDVTVLVGPEGGFADEEIRGAARAGAAVCRFGRHVMRVETAAVVAAAIVIDAAARGWPASR